MYIGFKSTRSSKYENQIIIRLPTASCKSTAREDAQKCSISKEGKRQDSLGIKGAQKVFIVFIEGSDPFTAADEGAIYRGLDDLEDGQVIDSYKTAHGFRIKYLNNCDIELTIVATTASHYK